MLTNENIGIVKNLVAMLEEKRLQDDKDENALIEVKTDENGVVLSTKFRRAVWLAITVINDIFPTREASDLQEEYSKCGKSNTLALDFFNEWFQPIKEICAYLK